MPCIKTGAHVYLEQYGEWAYGDVHAFGYVGTAIIDGTGIAIPLIYALRVSAREFVQPLYPVKHFTFIEVCADWRDSPYGTILCTAATNHGYEGVPV